jgi:hypothetical protein
MFVFHSILFLTVSIRIVADCGLQTCQVTQKLKRATTPEFTTVSAIIFIQLASVIIFYFKSFNSLLMVIAAT